MGFIAWLIIGGLAGWIAGNIMRGGGFGILGNIGVGVVGALVGGAHEIRHRVIVRPERNHHAGKIRPVKV